VTGAIKIFTLSKSREAKRHVATALAPLAATRPVLEGFAMVPAATAIYAAILGLLGAVLTTNVILSRVRAKVDAGDGGRASLAQAIRAHGNFAEQAPLSLILIGLGEARGARPFIVNILGVALVLSRLASAYALSRTLNQSPGRQFGGGLAVLIIAAASIVILLALGGIK
jgi:uncharacterized membrane protein YecN with MAPEG domain